MSYIPRAETGFAAHAWRLIIGAVAAPMVAALATEIPTFDFRDYWTFALLGFLSVVTLYLPLLLWWLPRSRHAFWACVLIGGISAPGPFGYAVGVAGTLLGGVPGFLFFVMLLTFPLGAIGGAVFWLCVVWRSDGWAGDEA